MLINLSSLNIYQQQSLNHLTNTRRMKTTFILSLLLIAAYSKVTPSPDFNITDFPGTWNLAGLYGLNASNMAPYSCASMNVNITGTLQFTTMNLSWIDSNNNEFADKIAYFVPSPLNNAIFISTVSPTAENNYVVAYYNSTARQAILISQDASSAFVLTGGNDYNSAHLFLIFTASKVLEEAGIDIGSVLEVFGENCDYGKLVPLAGFDVSSLVGKVYYANVIFTEQGPFDKNKDDLCSTIEIDVLGDFLNLTYTKGKTDKADNETVLPYPGMPAVFIDTAIFYSDPLVVTYQDTVNDIILMFREPVAIGLSTKTSMKPVFANRIVKALESQGFTVNSTNFEVIPTSCYQSQEHRFLSF